MSLSEQEQQALREIERSLLAEDPSFGASVQGEEGSRPQGRISAQGLAIGTVGLILLVAGVALAQVSLWFIALSVVGFLVMLGAGVWMLRSPQDGGSAGARSGGSDARAPRQDKGNERSSRLEENFRRRFEEGQS